MQKQSGFTLIELVVVIVILGILAAFAVPRFVGMQDEARSSTVEGLAGSIRGASSLIHGKALANQIVNGTIDARGEEVDVVYSYPNATEGNFEGMIQDLSGFDVDTGCGVIGNATSTGPCVYFTPTAVSNDSTCGVQYAEAQSSSDNPNIHVNATDCS